MKNIVKSFFAASVLLVSLIDSASADNKLNWYEMYDSNSNGQITLKDDTGQAVTAKVNPTGASARMAVTSATQPAITTRIRLGTAVENTPCSVPRDDIAVNADRTLILTCQSGVWAKGGAGRVISPLILERTSGSPAGCPIAWTQIDYQLVSAGGGNLNDRRTCLPPEGQICSVLYLERISGSPAVCPIAWAQVDYQLVSAGGGNINDRRTCIKC